MPIVELRAKNNRSWNARFFVLLLGVFVMFISSQSSVKFTNSFIEKSLGAQYLEMPSKAIKKGNDDKDDDDKPNNCALTVMIHTGRNSSRYIKEMAWYYLSHGASKVKIHDFSTPDEAYMTTYALLPLVQSGQVEYERDKFPFSEERHQLMLSQPVYDFINTTIQKSISSKETHWLITVDDDEYVYPDLDYLYSWNKTLNTSTVSNSSLLSFLCSPPILEYPVVNFRWRQVGTSGISHPRPGYLDLELYTKMDFKAKHGEGSTLGKSAYHITHPQMSVAKWLAQDSDGGKPLKSWKRLGGRFFLHGNYFRLDDEELKLRTWKQIRHGGKRKSITLDAGYTYHFARSQSERYERTKDWLKNQGKLINLNERDSNHVEDDVLKNWASSMRDNGWVIFDD